MVVKRRDVVVALGASILVCHRTGGFEAADRRAMVLYRMGSDKSGCCDPVVGRGIDIAALGAATVLLVGCLEGIFERLTRRWPWSSLLALVHAVADPVIAPFTVQAGVASGAHGKGRMLKGHTA
jgi:hypothetical protein